MAFQKNSENTQRIHAAAARVVWRALQLRKEYPKASDTDILDQAVVEEAVAHGLPTGATPMGVMSVIRADRPLK